MHRSSNRGEKEGRTNEVKKREKEHGALERVFYVRFKLGEFSSVLFTNVRYYSYIQSIVMRIQIFEDIIKKRKERMVPHRKLFHVLKIVCTTESVTF